MASPTASGTVLSIRSALIKELIIEVLPSWDCATAACVPCIWMLLETDYIDSIGDKKTWSPYRGCLQSSLGTCRAIVAGAQLMSVVGV